MPQTVCRRLGILPAALAIVWLTSALAAQTPPLSVGKQGYFFVGGQYFDAKDGRFMSGQMYVEYQIPSTVTRPYPIVMFSGGGQSGLNYTGTPDGREGWMQYFVRQGYAVYVLDQPSRARSPHQPEVGPQSRFSVERVQQRFTAPERSHLWPQATLHTQWPGTGVAGDPVFDQFFAQIYPSLESFPRQQELNRDAGAALLDRIGPSILVTHSQSGTFGWLVADARPALVKAIVALEPSGPPVHDNVEKGAPAWFEDGPVAKPYGLTAPPLAYDPPVHNPAELKFVRQEKPDAPDLVRCWAQAEPARTLANLRNIPVLVVQAEASYHAAYDHCTVAYLRQAKVAQVRFVRLAEAGIKGNGHMLMLEKNNLEIAGVAERWLQESVERSDAGILTDHPALAAGVQPFHRYISNESSLPAFDRELLILRTAVLTRSANVWRVHVPIALASGLSRTHLVRLGAGPAAPDWGPFEAALVRAADELHTQSFISEATWTALSSRYDRHQLMDAVFTVAHYSMWAMMENTVRPAKDDPATPLPPVARAAGPRNHTPLAAPRIPTLDPPDWTPEIRAMLDPAGNGRPVANVYRTYAQHPALYVPRQLLSEYIRIGSTLPAQVREMLILRIGFLCGSAYEWAAHARAGRGAGLSAEEIQRIASGPAAGWSAEDAAVLQAVDEIYNDDRVAPATWARLATRFDRKQLLDVLITAGGYRMVSMSLNTFGVAAEPNSEPLPVLK